MCGLAGIVDYQVPGQANERRARRLGESLRHRGPDGEGLYIGSHVALAHTRLAVVDREGGAQPFASPDGRFILLYNGEVYNYPELRDELRVGWAFRTQGDTEVVLAAFVRWGRACLTRLNGMFAFFVWDTRRERGFGARDGLGIKPLWYRWHRGEFTFASEAKAIVRDSDTRPSPNVEGILEYLVAPCFSGVSRSMFAGIEPLPAGHFFSIDHTGLHVERWWDYVLELEDDLAPAAELRHHLESAVRRALRADHPPNVFLSGGLDSTALAALAKRAGHSPRCFTICYHDQHAFDYANSAIVLADDLPHAQQAAQDLNLRCDVVRPDRGNSSGELEDLARIDDALPAWEQELSQFHLARFASMHGRSVLVGDAADETHYGYHFILDEEAIRSPRGIIERFASPWVSSEEVEYFALEYEQLCGTAGHSWQTHEGRMRATTYLIVKRWLARLLHNGDIHTMAHGLEARLPFADTELLDIARRIPPEHGFHRGVEKYQLREALAGIVPEPIRKRRKSALPKDQDTDETYRWIALRLAEEESEFLRAFLDVRALLRRCHRETPLSERERAGLFRTIALAHWRRHYGVSMP